MTRLPVTLTVLSIGVLVAVAARGHDMFLVVPDHDLPAGTLVRVDLYNGTFDKSENAIARDRMIDVSIVDGAGRVAHPDSSSKTGPEGPAVARSHAALSLQYGRTKQGRPGQTRTARVSETS